jgi:glycosyltransferase involved in cell wall biosynthesis
VELCSFDRIPARRRAPVQAQQLAFPFVASLDVLRRWRWADVVDGSSGDLWPLLAARKRDAKRGPVIVTRSHGLEHANDGALRAEAAAGNLRLSRVYPLYRGGWYLREVEMSFRFADAAFFLNDDDRDYAVGRLGVAAERAYVFDNGLSQAFIGLPHKPANGSRPTVVQVGSFSQRKGIAYSVPALARILAERPDARAVLLGTGVSREDVLRSFPSAIRGRIEVTERYEQDQLPTLIRGGAVGLFAAVSEGFGKTVLETMACGIPPVAASAPGPRRLIAHAQTGMLVPVRDPAALAQATLLLLDDEHLRSRLAAAAHERVQGCTWEAAARHRLATYETLLRSRRRSQRHRGIRSSASA